MLLAILTTNCYPNNQLDLDTFEETRCGHFHQVEAGIPLLLESNVATQFMSPLFLVSFARLSTELATEWLS